MDFSSKFVHLPDIYGSLTMKHVLHYVWEHKIFPSGRLQTSDGRLLEVADTGQPNPGEGPAFLQARIKIGETLWIGDIEIQTRSSDCTGSANNPSTAYDSVVLYVVSHIDCEIKRANGETVPQLKMVCPAFLARRYEDLTRKNDLPACRKVLPRLSRLTVHSWLTALQSERLEQKSIRLHERLKQCAGNWEDAFFITLARNFGFGLNSHSFETWAFRLPLRAIDKHRDNLFQIEALFFGKAGWLQKDTDDAYYRQLQKEYAFLSRKFELQETDESLTELPPLHPGCFPPVKIAQLAYLLHSQYSLFSRVMEAATLKEIKDILRCGTSEYWKTHDRFGVTSPRKDKILSDSSLNLILINTVVTFLHAYGQHKADLRLCERAERFLTELPAENNHILRFWKTVGLAVCTAADSQALIQLRKSYCDEKRCLRCRFGYEYLKCREELLK